MSAPVQGEFPRHVVGGPEAHDLQEPLARRVGAMSEGEVGEDQRVTGGYWLRLPNHVPGRREPSELSSEALLKPAVVSARRAGRKDRVASAQLQGETAHRRAVRRAGRRTVNLAGPLGSPPGRRPLPTGRCVEGPVSAPPPRRRAPEPVWAAPPSSDGWAGVERESGWQV